MLPKRPGGAFAYPADPTRLQGGLCANPKIVTPREWDHLTDGTTDTHRPPGPEVQLRWNEAKSICKACPILAACEAQMMQQKLGVWGGTDQHERHNMRKAIQRAAAKERAKVKAAEPQTAPRAVPEPVLAVARPLQPFPVEDPPGYDGWVRLRQIVRSAFYIAQTSDGRYMKVKLKGDKAPMIAWVPAGDVDLRRSVTVEIQSWARRPVRKEPDGVQTPAVQGSAAA